MKLGEALLKKEEYIKKIDNLKKRVKNNVAIKEDNENNENPNDLIKEYIETNNELSDLMMKIINKENTTRLEIGISISEAINILEATMETIGEFCIDGSNGEHGDIQSEFKEIMEILLKKSASQEKEIFLSWLKEYIEEDDEFIDFKDEFQELYSKNI